RMGNAQYGREWRQPGAVARRQVRACAARLEFAHASSSAGARPWRRISNGSGAAARARSQQDLWLCRRRYLGERPFFFDMGVVPRGTNGSGSWKVRKVIEIPAEAADPDQLPSLLKG